ncbi:MAG: EndoU domain-containing protein [Bacilli bacterium]
MFKLFSHVSRNEMKHTSRGIFKYKDRKPVAMVKGGHGEDNIRYLEKNKLEFKIEGLCKGKARNGSIACHERVWEAKKDRHMWFPKLWSDRKIEKAGLHVANLKKNQDVPDHTPMHGTYKGVDVVAYKGRGRICGICPKFHKFIEEEEAIAKAKANGHVKLH